MSAPTRLAEGPWQPAPRRRRAVVLAVLGGVAFGLHVELLQRLHDAARVAAPQRSGRDEVELATPAAFVTAAYVIDTTASEAPPPRPAPAAPTAPTAPTAPAVAATRPASRPPVRTPTRRSTAMTVASQSPAAREAEPERIAEPTAPAPAPAPAPAASDGDPPPIYPTRLPPPATLRYALSIGVVAGHAELRWQPGEPAADGDGRYDLAFESRIADAPAVRLTSEGRFDTAGLGPVRHTDARRRRAPLAVNFQRDAGTVTFSAASSGLAWRAGVQDGVSWMVQLAAVAEADPAQRAVRGATVVLGVVGARGGLETWRLDCVGRETVDSATGPVEAIRFQRRTDAGEASDGGHAAQVAVWLDPARRHLPVQARWRRGPDGVTTELRLESIEMPP